jgi:hypothetical protein
VIAQRLFAACSVAALLVQPAAREPVRGLSNAQALASAYDAILDADFDSGESRLRGACGPLPAYCALMNAISVWWQIALDPDDLSHDARFVRLVEEAIAAADAWTKREPQRAEAWFALGGAYGPRAQWRVLRHERLAAARDGKRIKETLERALTLDPALHDAKFGLGMYRYYADVGPAALRLLRWMLLLPGGDRRAGLREMLEARDLGFVVRGEADYQLHLIYLWYEHRAHDALALMRGLQQRYPHNPLFALIEADIHDVYFHDAHLSEVTLRALIARAERQQVNAPDLAKRRAERSLRALSARAPR